MTHFWIVIPAPDDVPGGSTGIAVDGTAPFDGTGSIRTGSVLTLLPVSAMPTLDVEAGVAPRTAGMSSTDPEVLPVPVCGYPSVCFLLCLYCALCNHLRVHSNGSGDQISTPAALAV